MSSSINIEQFFQTELKVATVTGAEPIPNSNKLLKLTVELGSESRVLVAGLARPYSTEELVGRQGVVGTNLAPAKLMGVESQGMVLAASVEGKPVLLQPGEAVPSGTPVK
jgi:methionine--tRNA ligase beta chain